MHNEIRDFYAHMPLTHERRFARCFCRYSPCASSALTAACAAASLAIGTRNGEQDT